jgi:hypothetical protein
MEVNGVGSQPMAKPPILLSDEIVPPPRTVDPRQLNLPAQK